jgi:anti-sigma factor RsiW
MNCSHELIEAYLDKELDAALHAEVEQHLAACQDCSEAYGRLRKQQAGIKAEAPYYSAPPALGRSVRDALRRMEKAEVRRPVSAIPWRSMAIAAGLLLAASVSWNVIQLRQRAAGEADLAGNVLTDHIRSLIGTHLVDVPSSDQHTVKPWFAGKLDFSPAVRDLDAQGFRLAGGRIEYLSGRRVAALVYYRRQHVINLFIWPDGSSGSEGRTSRDGYNLVHWTDGSMTYWAVSDVNAADLVTFRTLFR